MMRARWAACGGAGGCCALALVRTGTGSAAARRARRPGGAPIPSAAGVRSATLYFAAPTGDSLVVEPREVLEARERSTIAWRRWWPSWTAGRAGGGVGGAAGRNRGAARVPRRPRPDDARSLPRASRAASAAARAPSTWRSPRWCARIGANLPEVQRVLIVCGGRPLATLGGHLPLDQPPDVNDWP